MSVYMLAVTYEVGINVGGQVFRTTVDTLTRCPDCMLARLWSRLGDDPADVTVFIDRECTPSSSVP